MHVISRQKFYEATQNFKKYSPQIMDLYRLLNSVNFDSSEEMRRTINSLDNFKYVDKWYVIDIAGNNLRMLAYINFISHKIFIKYIVNHEVYNELTERGRKGELP